MVVNGEWITRIIIMMVENRGCMLNERANYYRVSVYAGRNEGCSCSCSCTRSTVVGIISND